MKPSLGKTILTAAVTIVVVSIIAGVILVGSPSEGRIERLDSTRIEDLRGIMRATDAYWDPNTRLPTTLEELAADQRTRVSTIDPGSAESYEYRTLGDETYELCATFDRESPPPTGRSSADFWRHGVGRQCFELNVDTSN